MILQSPGYRYYLYSQSVDMRLSFDGLAGLIRNELDTSPFTGEVYMFINKRRNQVKILQWDVDGFVIFYKRLEKGTFEIPPLVAGDKKLSITEEQLQFILRGIALKSIRKRTRFKFV